jgi:hypothetical protein
MEKNFKSLVPTLNAINNIDASKSFPKTSNQSSPANKNIVLQRMFQTNVRKNELWVWTARCESAFLKLKTELCSDRIFIPFDPSLPLVLTTDTSPTGLAAVLSHTIGRVEKLIAYASRSLSDSEKNYSQLDREASAIIFGVTHFYN